MIFNTDRPGRTTWVLLPHWCHDVGPLVRTTGWRPEDASSRSAYHCEVRCSGLLQYTLVRRLNREHGILQGLRETQIHG